MRPYKFFSSNPKILLGGYVVIPPEEVKYATLPLVPRPTPFVEPIPAFEYPGMDNLVTCRL